MRKFMAALLSVGFLLGLAAVLASPAQAATYNSTPGCVTYHEWKYKVHKGMTRQQVANAVGASGKLDNYYEYGDGSKDWYIEYRQCNRYGKPMSWWDTTWFDFANNTWPAWSDRIIWHNPPIVTYKGIWIG